jgi:hypothetical protein
MNSDPKSTDPEHDEADVATVYTPSAPAAPRASQPAPAPDSNAETVFTPRANAKPAPVPVLPPAVAPTPASEEDDNSTMHFSGRAQVSRQPRKSRSFRGALLVIVVLGIAGVALTQLLPKEGPSTKAPPPPTQADRTAGLLAEAGQAVANHQYAVAAATYQAVVNIDPANAAAQAGLAKAKAADAAQPILEQAQKQLAAKQHAEARATLRQIATDSPVADAARAIWSQVDADEAKGLLAQGLEQVKEGKLTAAKATLAKLKPLDDPGSAKLSAAIEDAEGGTPKK